MKRLIAVALIWFVVFATAVAARKPKVHVVALGDARSVRSPLGAEERRSVHLQIRTLTVDGKLKEYVSGEAHPVTDRLFVIRRAFRLNDNLPQERRQPVKWIWQRGGWLAVDRLTTHIVAVPLANFDSYFSEVAWFRDYAAYCGVSDNGEKLEAVVMQLGRRKPILRRELGTVSSDGAAACWTPLWERRPLRVTFHPRQAGKQVYSISAHTWDADDEDSMQP